jgi:hypothetical protein
MAAAGVEVFGFHLSAGSFHLLSEPMYLPSLGLRADCDIPPMRLLF